MKIIVVSDTHIPKKAKQLPARLKKELPEADLIIHAGDWQTIDVYEEFHTYGKVLGVYGNVDGEDIKQAVPEKQELKLNGWNIGIVHGHGKEKTTEKRAQEAFNGSKDVIIFGHSHIPYLRYTNKTLMFNPGSATDKRRQPYYSFGILTLTEELHAEHIFYPTLSRQ